MRGVVVDAKKLTHTATQGTRAGRGVSSQHCSMSVGTAEDAGRVWDEHAVGPGWLRGMLSAVYVKLSCIFVELKHSMVVETGETFVTESGLCC